MERAISYKNVTKYWRNQKPHIDLSSSFTDKFFPPDEKSILAQDSKGNFIDPIAREKNPNFSADEIEWKKASEIFKNPQVFEDKIEFNDIKQGSLGNCYFMSAIAALTEYPKLIYKLFVINEVNTAGYYEIILFIDGEWQIVIVDDWIPCIKGTKAPKFAKPNGEELWVILLEKAWAKINGGYLNTISGWPNDPLSTLTGFSSKKLQHENYTEEQLFKEISEFDSKDYIMCCTTLVKYEQKNGLVANHAYSLIDAVEVNKDGETVKLVEIRNPWGYGEWTGDWSDKSDLWTDSLKKQAGAKDSDDGIFFMSIEDFKKNFRISHACKIENGSKSKSYSHEDLSVPHVYRLYLPEEEDVCVTVVRPQERFNRQFIGIPIPMSLVMTRYETVNGELKLSHFHSDYESSNNVDIIGRLPAGNYLIWFFSPNNELKAPRIEKLILLIYSRSDFYTEYVGPDKEFKLIRKVLVEDLEEIHKKQIKENTDNVVCKILNMHKETGLAVFFVHNNQQLFGIDYKFENKVENIILFGKYKEKESNFIVRSKAANCFIGLRGDMTNRYWFNVQATGVWVDANAELDSDDDPKGWEQFLVEEIKEKEVYSDFYDHVDDLGLKSKQSIVFTNEAKPKDKEGLKDLMFNLLKEKNENVYNLIIEFKDLFLDNQWEEEIHNNGTYIGQLDENLKRFGVGYYLWDNGMAYVGEWRYGIKEGKGKMLQNDRLTYEGTFENGMKSGYGVFYYKNGDVYTGEFRNDMQNGDCTYRWSNGSTWIGTAVDNKLHGTGTFRQANGIEREIVFEYGAFK